MSIGGVIANDILNTVLRQVAWTATGTIKIALYTADPGTTGTSNEVSGGSYARQTATFNAASSASCAMASAVSFTSMPAATVSHIGVWSDETTDRFLFGGALTGGSQAVTAGNTFTLSTLTVSLT